MTDAEAGVLMELADVRSLVWLHTDELAELTADGDEWDPAAILTQAAAVVASVLYVERVATRQADALIVTLPSVIRAILGRLEKSGLLEGGIRVEQTLGLIRGGEH